MIVSGEPVESEKLGPGHRLTRPGRRFRCSTRSSKATCSRRARLRAQGRGQPPEKVRDLKVEHENAEVLSRSRAYGASRREEPAGAVACVYAITASISVRSRTGSEGARALHHAHDDRVEVAAPTLSSPSAPRARSPDVPEGTPTRPIAKACVTASGTMGGGIAMNFPTWVSGHVCWKRSRKRSTAPRHDPQNYESTLNKGNSRSRSSTSAWASSRHARLQDISDADIVIEAVFERWA